MKPFCHGILIEAMGFTSEEYRASKATTHPRMAQIAPVVCLTPEDLEAGRVDRILADELFG